MTVSKWAAAKTERTPAQALGELARMPSYGSSSLVQAPFPKIDKSEYLQGVDNAKLNAAIEAAPIKSVPLHKLRSIQGPVERARVAEFIQEPKQLPKGTRDPAHGGLTDIPVVVAKGEHLFLHDGHHRATAAKLLGKQSIQARYVTLPAAPGWGTGNPGSRSASSGVGSASS